MQAVNIEDLRRQARRKLPKPLFDFVDGGAMDERTLAANSGDFARIRFLGKALAAVGERQQNVQVLGQDFGMPLILSPTGLTGVFGPGGEAAAARAAKAAGAGFCSSTVATTSIEALAQIHPGFWFQLYIQRDRGFTRALVERAAAAGCPVLCVTTDTVVAGKRERDIRNGFSVPPKMNAHNFVDFLLRPGWLWRMATGPRISFANFPDQGGGRTQFATVSQQIASQFDPDISWNDIAWLKEFWPGKIALKGVMHPEDVRRAVDNGVDGIIVSNHGGRQLDGAISTIAALPAVVEAADGRLDVLIDSGIRRGTDVVKALALGAKACMIGRAFVYGLAAAGEAGVGQTLSILRGEIDNVQALIGCPDIRQVDRSFLQENRQPWPANR
jgi:L-lactate dehydrogenase (cytochrome)